MGAIIAHHGLLLVSGPGYGSLPFSDGFDTNTIANYTVTKDSGSPTWVITGGAMNANAALGTQSCCTVNGFSAANASAEVVVSQATDAGIVVRFQDQSNFYMLALTDDVVNSTQNLRLYKRVSGTFTQIGSTLDVSFPRTSHTIRLTANGSTISAYFDGVQVYNVTDTSISAAGKVGMRSNQNSGDFFDSFSWG